MLMYATLQRPLSRDVPLLALDRASTHPLQRVIVHTDIAQSNEPLALGIASVILRGTTANPRFTEFQYSSG